MKILLCRPVDDRLTIIVPNLGLGYLSAALKRDGHEVRVLDCPRKRMDLAGFRALLKRERFDLAGIQILSCDYPAAKEMFNAIKEADPKTVAIAGGPHISGLPLFSMHDCPSIDYALTGEADISIGRFCNFLDGHVKKEAVSNLVFRDGGTVIVNKQALPRNLDALGMPDWSSIDPRTYPPSPHGFLTRAFPVAPIITSRGCPYECTYCNAKAHAGRKLRTRSAENIIGEIRFLRDHFSVREIHIEDDNFTFDRARAIKFCEMLIGEKMGLSWACPNGVRLDRLDKELLQLMERAGCYSMAVGIESGSARVLRDMKRHITLDVIREKLDLITSCTKIHLTGFFIIGYPSEIEADVRKTLRISRELPLHRVQFSNFVPLPGTEIFDRLVEKQEISPATLEWKNLRDNYTGYVPHELTACAIRRFMRTGFLRFYLRPRILRDLMREIHSWRQVLFLARRVLRALR